MSDTERGICPECGEEKPVNQDGTIRKHGSCPTGLRPKQSEDPANAESPNPDDEDHAPGDGPDDWDDEDEDGPGPDENAPTAPTEGDEAAGEQRAEDLGEGRDGYRWQITVAQPALYLDDPAWHAANSQMAAQRATEEGHVPTGEAQCTGVAATEDGTGLVLTYLLPVESAS